MQGNISAEWQYASSALTPVSPMGHYRLQTNGVWPGTQLDLLTISGPLELKVPHGEDLGALRPLIPVFLSYVLSFVYVGIYWNNHHHMLQVVRHINGRVLWANLHLLFWLSLLPFVTGWMGENHFAALPSAMYGFVLLLAGIAYSVLTRALMAAEPGESLLRKAVGKDTKGKISVALYAIAIPLAFLNPWIAQLVYVVVALTWLVPDRRIERLMATPHGE
jgi:uncharacterized membrane protein